MTRCSSNQAEAQAARFAVLRSGLSRQEIARRVSLSPKMLADVIGGRVRHRARLRVEFVLESALWSPLNDFRRRQRISEYFKAPIYGLSRRCLEQLAFESKLPKCRFKSREQAILYFERVFAKTMNENGEKTGTI